MSRKSVSRKIMLCFCMMIFLIGIGCSSSNSDGDSSGDSSNKITQEEVNQLMASLTGAVDASGANSSSSANVKAMEISPNIADGDTENSANDVKGGITLTNTCSTSDYNSQAALNDSTSCSSSGHITWTGNMKIYCTSWKYYNPTQYSDKYCSCDGDWRSQTMIVFQYGDRTNNLYDCDMGGLIVDGTVTFTMSGPTEAPDMQYVGTLSLNRRGVTGGLHQLGSCSINYGYWGNAKQWHGTICGRQVQ